MKVETAAEIVAKKMWHRGDRATARDFFDLSLVIERDPAALLAAGEFLVRHRDTFLEQLAARDVFIRQGFSDIRTLGCTPTFDRAVALATEFLREIPEAGPVHRPRS